MSSTTIGSSVPLTETQMVARDLAQTIVDDFGREYWFEKVLRGEYPTELWQALVDTGLLGMAVPTEYGGTGGGLLEVLAVSETLGAGGMRMSSWQHLNFTRAAVARYGSDEQKAKILAPSVEGKVRISLCVTEPDSGTNTFRVRTFADPQVGGGYRVNGHKAFIGGADIADYYMLVARTKPWDEVQQTKDGIAAFLIDRHLPGISVSRMDIVIPDTVGRFFVHFDDVDIPDGSLLGTPEDGLMPLFANLNADLLSESSPNNEMLEPQTAELRASTLQWTPCACGRPKRTRPRSGPTSSRLTNRSSIMETCRDRALAWRSAFL